VLAELKWKIIHVELEY